MPAHGCSAFVNEDGKRLNLPENRLATEICLRSETGLAWEDFVCGPFVVIGPADANGDTTDVPQAFVDWAYDSFVPKSRGS